MARHARPPVHVTQEQIAKALGLSQFTVSHALRGTGKVAPETTALILATAQRLGYRINVAARATATGRTGTIALLRNSDPRTWWFPLDLFHGLETGVERQHLRLITARMPYTSLEDEAFIPRILQELVADGVVVHCPMHPPEHLVELLQRYRIPAIWINTRLETDTLRPDDAGLARMIVRHLLRLGHRRFIYIRPVWNAHWSEAVRRAAVQDELVLAGCPPLQVIDRSSTGLPAEAAAIVAVHAALVGPQRPTAAIGYGHGEAQEFRAAAALAGLRIPEELSIAVIGGDQQTNFNDPLATTAGEIDWGVMGERAVALLCRKIAEPSMALPAEEVAPRMQVGRSCAPPAADQRLTAG